MKRILRIFYQLLLSGAFLYGLFSLINWNYNPGAWPDNFRIFLSVLLLITFLVIIIINSKL